MNPLVAYHQRVVGILQRPKLPLAQNPPNEEEGLSFSQKFKKRMALLDRNQLPDLPLPSDVCLDRYRAILKKSLVLNLEHGSQSVTLSRLLQFFYSYKVSLAGKMAKFVLGNEWFSQVAKAWVQLEDDPDLGLSDKTDIDFRVEVQNEDPHQVAENFLKWIAEKFFSRFGETITVCNQLRRRGGPFEHFEPILEGDGKGQCKTNVFLISYKSDDVEVDFYIVNTVTHSAASSHENLVIEVNPGRPFQVSSDGKESVVDYLAKELRIVNEHPRSWVRIVCDRLAGFHLEGSVPAALLQSFSKKRIDDLEKLFRHRFGLSNESLYRLGRLALKDLLDHQVDPQWIDALFEKIQEMGVTHLTWTFLAYHFRHTRQICDKPDDVDEVSWLVHIAKQQKYAVEYLSRFFSNGCKDLEGDCLEALMPSLFLVGNPEQFKKDVKDLSQYLLKLIDHFPESEGRLKHAFGEVVERVFAAKRLPLCKSLFDSEFSKRYPKAFSQLKSRVGALYFSHKKDMAGALSILANVQEFVIDEEGLALELLETLLLSGNAKEVEQGLRLYERAHHPVPHNLQSWLSHISDVRDKAEVELQAKRQRLPDMLLTIEANDFPNKYARLLEVLQVVSDETPEFQVHLRRIVNILHSIPFTDEQLPPILELILPLLDYFLKDCEALILGMVLRSPPQSKEEWMRLKPLVETPRFPWVALIVRLCEQKKTELLKDLLLESGTGFILNKPLPEKTFYELIESPDPFSKTFPLLLKMMENNLAVAISEPERFFHLVSVQKMIPEHIHRLMVFAQQNLSKANFSEFGQHLLLAWLRCTPCTIDLEVQRSLYPHAPKDPQVIGKMVSLDPDWWVMNKPEEVRSVLNQLSVPLQAIVEPFYHRNPSNSGAEKLLNSVLEENKNLLFEMIERAVSLPLPSLKLILWKQFFQRYRKNFTVPIQHRVNAFHLMSDVPLENRAQFCQMADVWIEEMITTYFAEDCSGLRDLAKSQLFEVVFSEIGALILARFRATSKKEHASALLNHVEQLVRLNKREPLVKLAFDDEWYSMAIEFVRLVTKHKSERFFPTAFSFLLDSLDEKDEIRLRLAAESAIKFSQTVSMKAVHIKLDSEGIKRCYDLCVRLEHMPSVVSGEQSMMVARNFTELSPFNHQILAPYVPRLSRMVLSVRQIAGVITYREQLEIYGEAFDSFTGAHIKLSAQAILALVIFYGLIFCRNTAYEYFNITAPTVVIKYMH